MTNNTVRYLRDILNEILKIDPDATLQFEDCGSGTNVLNIVISDESASKLSMKDLDNLEKLGLYGDDEGSTVGERLMGRNTLFICLS